MSGARKVDAPEAADARVGVLYGLAAYGWWGLVPIYFKAVSSVPAMEVLAHRVVWSLLLLAVWMRLRRRWRVAVQALRSRITIATLLITTCLIATNWFLFIWAVAHDQVLQASLGYFINPLVNVLLGFVFLRERLRRWQWVAVAMASGGVAYLTSFYGSFPWIAVVLACSFGLYGLLRKTAKVDALTGLTVETGILLIPAVGYLVYLGVTGSLVFGDASRWMDVKLVSAGAVTALPLLWFANAARRLTLATLGFLQYLAPTGHLILGVLYGEPFTIHHAVAFAFIWCGLAVYSVDAYGMRRGIKGPRKAASNRQQSSGRPQT